jgi:hypothetical protein
MSDTAYDEVPVTSPRSPAVIMGGDDSNKVDDDDDGGHGHGHDHGGAGKTPCDKFKAMFNCTGCTPTLRTFTVFCALGGFMFGYVCFCLQAPTCCCCVCTCVRVCVAVCGIPGAACRNSPAVCPPARPVRLSGRRIGTRCIINACAYPAAARSYDLGLISGAIHYMIADLGNCTQEEWIEWNRTRVPMDNDFNLNSSNAGDDEHCNTWTSGDVAIVIGAAKIGAVVGTLISGFLMDIGRRTTVGFNCAFFS